MSQLAGALYERSPAPSHPAGALLPLTLWGARGARACAQRERSGGSGQKGSVRPEGPTGGSARRVRPLGPSSTQTCKVNPFVGVVPSVALGGGGSGVPGAALPGCCAPRHRLGPRGGRGRASCIDPSHWSLESGADPGSRAQYTQGQIQGPGLRLQRGRSRVQGSGYRGADPGSRAQYTQGQIQGPGLSTHSCNPGYRAQATEDQIQGLGLNLQRG